MGVTWSESCLITFLAVSMGIAKLTPSAATAFPAGVNQKGTFSGSRSPGSRLLGYPTPTNVQLSGGPYHTWRTRAGMGKAHVHQVSRAARKEGCVAAGAHLHRCHTDYLPIEVD